MRVIYLLGVMKMTKRIVGIDPDLTKSGVAVVEEGQLSELMALAFPKLLDFAREQENVVFVVENVEHDKTTYHRKGTNTRQHARIAQNVGQVKGVARVLIECLESFGCDVVKIKPLTGPVKRRAKKEAAYFNQITGWSGRTNADMRDAGLIALSYSKQ